MAKLYDRLFAHRVFRVEQVKTLVPEWTPQTARQRLKDLAREGRVGRVRSGVYFVVLPGERPEATAVDPYLVGSRLAPDSILAYHTSLELLGTAYSATRVVYYLSARYRKPLSWRGVTYRQVTPPRALSRRKAERLGVVTQERDGLEVSHTGRARTFVDCLDRLDLAGGVEELFRSVEAWPTVDPQEVLHYLNALNKVSVYAKVGYVLEYFSKPWGLTPSDLAPLRRHLPRAAVYLESRQKPGRFVSDWNLMVPADLKFLTAVAGERPPRGRRRGHPRHG